MSFASIKECITNSGLIRAFSDVAHALKPVRVAPYPALPPDISTPEDWNIYEQAYTHQGDEKTADIVYSPARTEHAKGDIFYSLGWNTHPLEKRDVILDLQNKGYNVITMPLVEANGSIGTMAENITRMKSTLFNKNSVLHNLRDENRPLFVITHSTSANVYETALQESKTDDLYRPDIKLVIPTNPFIHPVGLGAIYLWHARRHSDEHAGTPLADRLYYLSKGIVDKLRFEDPRGRPTHGQILEITEYGDNLLKNYNIGEASDPPIIAYISENDDFASASVAKDYYNSKLNLKGIHIVEAKHNVLTRPELRSEIIDILNQHSDHIMPERAPFVATQPKEEESESLVLV